MELEVIFLVLAGMGGAAIGEFLGIYNAAVKSPTATRAEIVSWFRLLVGFVMVFIAGIVTFFYAHTDSIAAYPAAFQIGISTPFILGSLKPKEQRVADAD